MDLHVELINFKWAGPGTYQEVAGSDMTGSVSSSQLTGGLSLSVLTHI